MIVEETLYYAKPDRAEAVLDMRRRGLRLRRTLGLPAGEVFVSAGETGPDVRWQCRFATREEFDADIAARDHSAEFAEQRRAMGALLARFERHVYRLDVDSFPQRTEIA